MLKEQLSRLAFADLAIFISPNAVKYGLAAIDGAFPEGVRVATVGQGSAKALRESGVVDVIVPVGRFDSEGLLAMPELQSIAGWRVMIFRGDGGRELLGDTLKARGAEVEYVTCYQRSKPCLDMDALASADVVTVTSSEAMSHLSQALADSGEVFKKPLFVPHTRIAQLARIQGWQDVHQTEAGDEGLLSGLMEWAKVRIQDSGMRSYERKI